MYLCYVCGTVVTNFATFRSHINSHAWECELPRPIRCLQDNCKSTFEQTYNFFRHVSSYHCHSNDVQFNSANVANVSSETFDNGVEVSEWQSQSDQCSISVSECQRHVETEGITLVAALRANSAVPYCVIPQVIKSFNDVSSSIVTACKIHAVNCLSALNAGGASVDEKAFSEQLNTSVSKFEEPFGFLASRHKLDSFFSNHPSFVPPESVCFGLRFETKCAKTKPVYDTFQYVSIEKTMKSLLGNEHFYNSVLTCQSPSNDLDVIAHYSDAQQAKRKRTSSDGRSLQIGLQIFYDGMGTTNPLRGQSSTCNVGVFYYVIKNLPDSWNTCYANVHLLALCYECDLKYHGFGAVLDKVTEEICKLSAVGFQMEFPVTGKQTVKVNLCQVTCDNLALNAVLGFIESFSGDYFCTMCYATREDSQTKFREECFHLRTPFEYSEDVTLLSKAPNGPLHIRGVKRPCELNNIPGYHVTENFSNDIMHTLLEGVVPLEIGCVLHYLVTVKQLFSLNTLNERVSQFWGVANVDRQKKPPQLNKIPPPGGSLSPSMKATQCWGLLKYLPLIIGDMVPPDDEHYVFLLHLSDLVDLVFAPRFTVGMVAYMKEFIDDHLQMFTGLFAGQVSLKPKHHFLIHLPTIVLKSGPLIGMSCLRYELKNSFFKRCCHVACNFTNICKTLAYRHQQFALFSCLSGMHQRNIVTVRMSSCVPVFTLPFCIMLCDTFGIAATDDVYITHSLFRGSVQYKQGHHFLIAFCVDEHIPVFARLEYCVSTATGSEWYLLVQKYKTLGYMSHFHSYVVKLIEPAEYQILSLSDLVDFRPVCCYLNSHLSTNTHFIRLHYHLW